ncbi:putative holin-like toxin [Lacticaseibacillus jixianensis]|uniref:Holin-like toxin n=1 Tax=Lacticaseibacillus jixianensis TaxID=2486012 RepID=A0ABW4B8J5_9LACO|nr:putative holin-like toxin [Lacticaseibacillus jixianensis]
MSVADAITLMLMFGGFILSLIGLIVAIIQAIVDKKDR